MKIILRNMKSTICRSFLFVVSLWVLSCSSNHDNTKSPNGFLRTDDLQEIIDKAAPYSKLAFDPAQEYMVTEGILIDKPLIIEGLRARLADSIGVVILSIKSNDVVLRNLHLTGNAKTVEQDNRVPLIHVSKGGFLIEDSQFHNSSKDGIEVSNLDADPIVGGIIRNIIGRGNMRDLVSINGENDGHINHLLVENIRCYDSELRGAVEVSDGTMNTTVRKIYAENSIYALDVQDHGDEGAINQTVTAEGIIAVNCRHAIRTANSPIGHSRHVFKNITADNCERPLSISNIDGVYIEDVHIRGHAGEYPAVSIKNCNNVILEDIIIRNSQSTGSGLLIENSDYVFIDHACLTESKNKYGILYNLTDGREYSSLMINNSILNGTIEAGILLKAENGSKLLKYRTSNNISEIDNQL